MNQSKLLYLSAILLSSNLLALEKINYNGDIANLNLSATFANEIIFPSNITDKIFSKEKGLIVKIVENSAYVKWTPGVTSKLEDDGAGKSFESSKSLDYSKVKKADLFVKTEDGNSYSFILKPVDMPPETIVINDAGANSKKTFAFESKDTYPETIKKLTMLGMDYGNKRGNTELDNYVVKKIAKQISFTKEIAAVHVARLQGAMFNIDVFSLKNTSNDKISINEKKLLGIKYIKSKLASSLYSFELFPYETTVGVIISKAGDDE